MEDGRLQGALAIQGSPVFPDAPRYKSPLCTVYSRCVLGDYSATLHDRGLYLGFWRLSKSRFGWDALHSLFLLGPMAMELLFRHPHRISQFSDSKCQYDHEGLFPANGFTAFSYPFQDAGLYHRLCGGCDYADLLQAGTRMGSAIYSAFDPATPALQPRNRYVPFRLGSQVS